jgi:hypothetical protein
VASVCLESFPTVHELLIAAREIAADENCIVGPGLALCASAHAAGWHSSVIVTLLELLEVNTFDGDVPSAWLVSTRSVEGEADYWLRRLVRRWTERFGGEHYGVRAIICDRADVWFPTRRFRLDVLRALHAAEPTAAGWVALAGRRSEMNGPLGLSFGDRQTEALSLLREALLRVLPAATHTALKAWLEELTR